MACKIGGHSHKSLLLNVLRAMGRYQCYRVPKGWLSLLPHGFRLPRAL
jgi:hypothetical protein